MSNKNPRQVRAQKLKIDQRIWLIGGGLSVIALAVWITMLINHASVNSSAATSSALIENDPVNRGQVIARFTWDMNPAGHAETGPEAKEISKHAVCMPGGVDGTYGLSAGKTKHDISMKLYGYEAMNDDGIDVSIDFRRFEESGMFFSRGDFAFGIRNGFLCIRYEIQPQNGKSEIIDEITSYAVPEDHTFRNYRFIFKPSSGRGEILVNNVTVWFNNGISRSMMMWNAHDMMTIGEGMNGGGTGEVIFDNMMIRRTSSFSQSPIQLLSFTAEMQNNNILLQWFTGKETDTEYFRVERSTDTKTYTEVGMVKAAGMSEALKEYSVLDTMPTLGITYYRLGLSNYAVHSIWVPVIAFRLKPEMLTSSASGNEMTLPQINVSSAK